MKKIFSFLVIAGVVAATQIASADVIDSVVVDTGGGSLTTINTGAGNVPTFSQAIIQEFTSGGVTYDSFATGTFVGDVEGVLYAVGGTAPAGALPGPGAASGPDGGALSDLDLQTGSLDPYGTSSVTGPEYWDFSGQTIDIDTVFFLFNNGTPTAGVTLVDSTGAAISNTLSNAATGGETALGNFDFDRNNGGTLNNRDVAGNTFAVSEFTLNTGFTVADIAGFAGGGPTFDAHDAGIAFVAVPEPSSAIVLLGGLGALLVRRRK